MNKAFTLFPSLIALSLSTSVATAQVSHTRAHHAPASKSRQQLATILARQQAAYRAANTPAAKTTATSERLIASSMYNFDATSGMPVGKTDSAAYKYSGSRGSKFNRDMMSYINPSSEFTSAGWPLLPLQYGGAHIASGHMTPQDIMADSTIVWNSYVPNVSSTYGYGISELVNQTYDANNNIIQSSEQYDPVDTLGNWNRYINTYDANNNIISSINLVYNTPNWDTMSRVSYIYNASHQLIEDSTDYWDIGGAWTPDSKNTYSYTGSDLTYSVGLQYASGVWEERSKIYLTYNADHSVHTDSMSDYMFTGTWEPSTTDSFGYTTGVDYWTYYRQRYYDGPDMDDFIATKHVSASGLPDTFYVADHSTYSGVAPSYLVYGMRAGFTYDSYNNPVTYSTVYYNITDSASGAGSYGTTSAAEGHYYYEPYTTTGINNIPKVQEAMSMYPNPATNELNISRPSAVKGDHTIINFTNALGQIIRTESMPWMKETETFSLAGFAPGMYIVTVQNKNGAILSTQKIMKQ